MSRLTTRTGLSRRRPYRTIRGPLLLVVSIILVVGALVVFFGRLSPEAVMEGTDAASRLRASWESGDYAAVVEASQQVLATAPLDPQALAFGGFAHFYRGVNEVDPDLRQASLAEASTLLRLALLLDRPPAPGEVSYVLAKSYFHRGPFYHDVVTDYMQKAIDAGYVADDTYEYLALAYETLGRYDEAVRSLEAALEHNPSDLVRLTLGQLHNRVGNLSQARQRFAEAIEGSDDAFLVQEARYGLATVYHQEGRLDDAEEQYRAILAQNERAADAHYQLGLVYETRGDSERARFEWRQALSIDPNHAEALESLRRE